VDAVVSSAGGCGTGRGRHDR
jgi:transposase